MSDPDPDQKLNSPNASSRTTNTAPLYRDHSACETASRVDRGIPPSSPPRLLCRLGLTIPTKSQDNLFSLQLGTGTRCRRRQPSCTRFLFSFGTVDPDSLSGPCASPEREHHPYRTVLCASVRPNFSNSAFAAVPSRISTSIHDLQRPTAAVSSGPRPPSALPSLSPEKESWLAVGLQTRIHPRSATNNTSPGRPSSISPCVDYHRQQPYSSFLLE